MTESEPTTIIKTITVTDLNRMVYGNRAKCEYEHTKTTCSVAVTHKGTCCTDSLLICEVGATQMKARMDSAAGICGGCLRPSEECWEVLPV